ncbi:MULTISPECIES: twin-arginine translocase TatA/TatE family subunit [Pasteurellaceae]|uniref:Sec-independent protein translocase protein TatA n=2 Tax=Pasteurellaceae TaxID=712 RepID=A0A1H7YY13_9PAST|nr:MULTISPECIES: twin-arginine translocase TatA/TatE family subunit [Pasteurella]MBR0573184.1 twin-arginine translocase TatA/TatE family subunit [Pasteurella atlantica]MDP8039200.1 twin-arginine translocase TatA/TatE family subunit [Pasteurella atlantica]MDP8041201.1 twin-arginine translocase TatA/TatE family subunit [Pasteurella atlantica]MDP8043338.1 twin-arginine translocase TatA/TatE family subunit [Pasteurella atlantica]MDP8045424.1 twin-arginine translocase TatA/TatE family subunit [Past
MGISPWQLLAIVVVVILLFGTKKLRNMGSDLGGAMKDFKKAMKDEGQEIEAKDAEFEKIVDEVKQDTVKQEKK